MSTWQGFETEYRCEIDPHEDGVCYDFELAEAIYWYCSDYHSGQWSEEYGVLCQLGMAPFFYRPSPIANGINPEESEIAADLYARLEAKDVTAAQLLGELRARIEQRHDS